jgi:hypothetical protein
MVLCNGPQESPQSPQRVLADSRALLPANVTILRHCRCMDCILFSQFGSEYVCRAGIGGTGVV